MPLAGVAVDLIYVQELWL